jgi:hypothetical protein
MSSQTRPRITAYPNLRTAHFPLCTAHFSYSPCLLFSVFCYGINFQVPFSISTMTKASGDNPL